MNILATKICTISYGDVYVLSKKPGTKRTENPGSARAIRNFNAIQDSPPRQRFSKSYFGHFDITHPAGREQSSIEENVILCNLSCFQP